MFDELISPDEESNEYSNFTQFAWDALIKASDPMPDDLFWPHVESLDWPNNIDDIVGLAKRLAARMSLSEAVKFRVAALDWTEELEPLMDIPEIEIGGEDSQEDFLYHLVGLGQSIVQTLPTDPAPAIEIAANESYVESFRYVLDGCCSFFHLPEYVDEFVAAKRFARSHSDPKINTMRKVDEHIPGIVIRVDSASYEIITPLDSRTVSFS